MDESGFFPIRAAHSVASEIGRHISLLELPTIPDKIDLIETFKVWHYPRILRSGGGPTRLRSVLLDSDYFHHQIAFDEIVSAYALTKQVKGSYGRTWEFRGIASSKWARYLDDLSRSISDAASLNDYYVYDDYVHMVKSPEHQITFLWKYGDTLDNDLLCVADLPPSANLKLGEILTGHEFLTRLPDMVRVVGLTDADIQAAKDAELLKVVPNSILLGHRELDIYNE